MNKNPSVDYAEWWQADEALNDNTLTPTARSLFEQYSHIPSTEVIPHILSIRRRAFEIHPYPCIGQFRFLNFSISTHPAYERVLSLLKSNIPLPFTTTKLDFLEAEDLLQQPPASVNKCHPVLLDVGCCVGQDLRKLAFDGVPAERLMGLELEQPFIDLGYDLFRDRESFKGAILSANLLDSNYDALLGTMSHRVDLVHAASFFHLFEREHQVEAAVKIVRMMKDKPGVMVFGRQIGSAEPGNAPRKSGGSRYLHNEESWQALWNEVGGKTGTGWKVEASWAQVGSMGPEVKEEMRQFKFLTYEVTRVS